MFFGLAATCVFILRRRDADNAQCAGGYRVPGHPWTTGLFVAVSGLVVINTVYKYPANTVIGFVILLAGIPAYFFWKWRNGK